MVRKPQRRCAQVPDQQDRTRAVDGGRVGDRHTQPGHLGAGGHARCRGRSRSLFADFNTPVKQGQLGRPHRPRNAAIPSAPGGGRRRGRTLRARAARVSMLNAQRDLARSKELVDEELRLLGPRSSISKQADLRSCGRAERQECRRATLAQRGEAVGGSPRGRGRPRRAPRSARRSTAWSSSACRGARRSRRACRRPSCSSSPRT